MPVQPPPPSGTATRREQAGSWLAGSWTRLLAHLPMSLALAAVAAVWAFGAVWSYNEQTAFAGAKTFEDPALLPLVIDGFAIATAGVAFAASLDGRPAVFARLMTVLGVAASAVSNGVYAAERSGGAHGPDMTTVAIGMGIPIAANIAFEVLLAELRRQVQRRRGLPAPVALPSLRLIRLVLAPGPTFREWRTEVLARTAQTHDEPAQTQDEPRRTEVPETPTVQPPAAPVDEPSTPVDEEPAGDEERTPTVRQADPATEPVMRTLHVVDAPTVQPDEPEDEPEQHPDPLLRVGTYRKAQQCRDVAKALGITRRSASWSTADFNEVIDAHISKHGPNPAPEYKEAR